MNNRYINANPDDEDCCGSKGHKNRSGGRSGSKNRFLGFNRKNSCEGDPGSNEGLEIHPGEIMITTERQERSESSDDEENQPKKIFTSRRSSGHENPIKREKSDQEAPRQPPNLVSTVRDKKSRKQSKKKKLGKESKKDSERALARHLASGVNSLRGLSRQTQLNKDFPCSDIRLLTSDIGGRMYSLYPEEASKAINEMDSGSEMASKTPKNGFFVNFEEHPKNSNMLKKSFNEGPSDGGGEDDVQIVANHRSRAKKQVSAEIDSEAVELKWRLLQEVERCERIMEEHKKVTFYTIKVKKPKKSQKLKNRTSVCKIHSEEPMAINPLSVKGKSLGESSDHSKKVKEEQKQEENFLRSIDRKSREKVDSLTERCRGDLFKRKKPSKQAIFSKKMIKWEIDSDRKSSTERLIQCPICMMEYPEEEMGNVSKCKTHLFCVYCLVDYVDYNCHQMKTLDIKCPDEDCKYEGDPNEIKKVLEKFEILQKRKKSKNEISGKNEAKERKEEGREDEDELINHRKGARKEFELQNLHHGHNHVHDHHGHCGGDCPHHGAPDAVTLYQKYQKFKNRDLALRYGLKICPNENCSKILKKEQGGKIGEFFYSCDSCLLNFCPKCMNLCHTGKECAQAIDEEFNSFKEQNDIIQCPRCGVCIYKAKGCNHMTCA